jgi:hypothetical protein
MQDRAEVLGPTFALAEEEEALAPGCLPLLEQIDRNGPKGRSR